MVVQEVTRWRREVERFTPTRLEEFESGTPHALEHPAPLQPPRASSDVQVEAGPRRREPRCGPSATATAAPDGPLAPCSPRRGEHVTAVGTADAPRGSLQSAPGRAGAGGETNDDCSSSWHRGGGRGCRAGGTGRAGAGLRRFGPVRAFQQLSAHGPFHPWRATAATDGRKPLTWASPMSGWPRQVNQAPIGLQPLNSGNASHSTPPSRARRSLRGSPAATGLHLTPQRHPTQDT